MSAWIKSGTEYNIATNSNILHIHIGDSVTQIWVAVDMELPVTLEKLVDALDKLSAKAKEELKKVPK